MVGVGGRSKACDNCRRRRVKCDLAEPECHRCVKAHLQCGGHRDITIIPFNGQGRWASSSNEPRGATIRSGTERHISEIRQSSLTTDLRLSIPCDDLFTAYTHSRLLRRDEEIVLAPEVDHTITTQCFLALSTIYFGVEHREKIITQRGFRRYGNALGVLHKALGNDSASQSFDVLEAVMIMALIELLISDREDGWINHARGLEKLLDIRGPEFMASLPCLMVLEKTRPSIILAAIVLHQPTILARPEWKSKPWLIHPNRIDSLKLLFDIVADCPELFVLRDQATSNSNKSNEGETFQLLLAKCYRILRDLEEWEQDWALGDSFQYTEIPSPPTSPKFEDSDGLSSPIWPTILQYQSLYHANAMTVYNGALILVIRFILGLQLTIGDTLGCEALQERLLAAGFIICRSVDYHLDKMWDGKGSIALLFPLRMAYDAIGKTNPAIEAWMRGVLDDISTGSQGKWRTAKYLLDIGASNNTRIEECTN